MADLLLVGDWPVSDVKKLLKKHQKLNQLDHVKVVNHAQRNTDEWVLNTLMLDGYDVPFQYRRKTAYRSLKGARVNITFYPDTQTVGGLELETMKIVRIRRA